MHTEEFWGQLEHGRNVKLKCCLRVLLFHSLIRPWESSVYLQIFNQESIFRYLSCSEVKLYILTLYIWPRFAAMGM